MTRLLIAGGGTGGHLFPGVALAEELRDRGQDSEVLFVGTERGIESRLLPGLGWELAKIEVSGLKTVGLMGAVRGALRIPGALLQSRRVIKKFRPDVVVGVGGYASGPVVLAARMMGVPTAILEQNSIPGLTNRILGKVARRIFLSFAHSQSHFSTKKSVLVGNPIRKDILKALQEPSSLEHNEGEQKLRLFIFGGSQGARAVNEMAVAAVVGLAQRGITFDIVHQVGRGNVDSIQASYKAGNVEADCQEFIDNMASQYRVADIIVSRAGATTIAELGIACIPTILIPYPFAANNHQELNAGEMVQAGAALMLRQDEDKTGARLAEMLADLADDSPKREQMAEAMRGLGHAHATTKIVDWLVAQ